MRHGKKINHLGRTSEHRKAMLSNMATSLILHKRITTTVAKAKALKKYVEPLITKSKDNTTGSRRVAFSYLQNKEAIKELFDNIGEKVASRPGGYTRIIRTGSRLGDNADTCLMELVDFNELLLSESAPAKTKAKRTRRAGKAKKAEGNSEAASASSKADAKSEAETPAQDAPEGDNATENKKTEE